MYLQRRLGDDQATKLCIIAFDVLSCHLSAIVNRLIEQRGKKTGLRGFRPGPT